MKVLHIITGLGVGGAEHQLRSVLQHTRHESDVVTLYNPGPVADMIRADGGSVRDLGMTSNTQISALVRLWQLIRAGRYDVVHAHLYRSQIYGRPAAWLAATPVILSTEHSIGETHLERRPMTPGVRALYLGTEFLSDLTIAVSPAVRDRLLRWGVRNSRITVIPNGVDLQRVAFDESARERVRAEFGIGAGVYLIGVLGRLDPNKQFDMVIEAAAPLLTGTTRLLIVGKGAEQARLEQAAREHGVGGPGHLHRGAPRRRRHAVGHGPVRGVVQAGDVRAVRAGGAGQRAAGALHHLPGAGRAQRDPGLPGAAGTRPAMRAEMAAEMARRRPRAGRPAVVRRSTASRPSRRGSTTCTSGWPPAAAGAPWCGRARPARPARPAPGGDHGEVLGHRGGRLHRLAPDRGTAGRRARSGRAGRPEHRAAGEPARGGRASPVPPGRGVDHGPGHGGRAGQRARTGCSTWPRRWARSSSGTGRWTACGPTSTAPRTWWPRRTAAGARLLVASTSEIYGKNTKIGLREDDDRVVGSPLKSRWSYAEAKAIDESLVDCYVREAACAR